MTSDREHEHVRPGYWFKPRLFGLGVTPATWQGWIATFALIALILADDRWAKPDALKFVLAAVLIVSFVVLAWVKTDGGWRWRWGNAGKRR